MGRTMTETGTIKYTERAFEQDADLAMSSDIMRALVELITNADDAYGSADGEIRVDIVRPTSAPITIAVRDTARGLAPSELKSCFGILGEQQSGFHRGDDVRGLFGRGAKDTAAFGRTVFESIRDGVYGRFELARSGAWELSEEPATPDRYQALGIDPEGSGLSATVVVEKAGVNVPQRSNLIKRISRHVQLRRISSSRIIVVSDQVGEGQKRSDIAQWVEPPGELLVDTSIPLPDYGTSISVSLRKLATPSEGRLDSYSLHGIEVRGRKASYANTLFGASANEGNWIRGVVDCPAIDDLLRDYDLQRGNDPANPTRIIRRDRDGLNEDHPFFTALAAAVLGELAPILDALAPKNQALGGQPLRSDLQRAGRALAELLKSDLERIDEDEAPGGLLPTSVSPIVVIPPRVTLAPGSARSLTVLLRPAQLPHPLVVESAVADDAVVDVGVATDSRPHARLDDAVVVNIPLKAVALGTTVVTVSAGSSASASCEVRVHDEILPDAEPPDTLQWASSSMSVSIGKQRSVELIAPAELAPEGVLECRVHVDGDAIELFDDTIELELTTAGWLSGRCKVAGMVLDSSALLVATSGVLQAEGRIRVTKPGALAGMGLQIDVVDDARGNLRGQLRVDDTGFHVSVFSGHPGMRKLLGGVKSGGRFEFEQTPPARLVIAEVVASVVADWLISREAQRFPDMYNDAEGVLVERNRILTRYLVPVQTALMENLEPL